MEDAGEGLAEGLPLVDEGQGRSCRADNLDAHGAGPGVSTTCVCPHAGVRPRRRTIRTAQRATIPQQSSFSARRTSSLLCRHARIHKPAGNPSASGDMHRDAMMLNSWLKNGMLQARTNAKAPVVEVMASQCDAARQEPPALAVAGARRTCSALPTIWVAIT